MVLVGILIGLINALKLIQPIKDKYPGITYADLFQLASATAIEVSDFFSLL
jgi:L-ascorbate peroxidase